jgi:hypothetical protein
MRIYRTTLNELRKVLKEAKSSKKLYMAVRAHGHGDLKATYVSNMPPSKNDIAVLEDGEIYIDEYQLIEDDTSPTVNIYVDFSSMKAIISGDEKPELSKPWDNFGIFNQSDIIRDKTEWQEFVAEENQAQIESNEYQKEVDKELQKPTEMLVDKLAEIVRELENLGFKETVSPRKSGVGWGSDIGNYISGIASLSYNPKQKKTLLAAMHKYLIGSGHKRYVNKYATPPIVFYKKSYGNGFKVMIGDSVTKDNQISVSGNLAY